MTKQCLALFCHGNQNKQAWQAVLIMTTSSTSGLFGMSAGGWWEVQHCAGGICMMTIIIRGHRNHTSTEE